MRRNLNKGFTLIEALVALLVLSIGLLGIAALQMTGLRANMGAGFRSQATYLSYDILDRMRANRTVAIQAGSPYNIAFGGSVSGTSTAEQDLAAWKTSLATLPGGDGEVIVNAATGIIQVSVRWNDVKDRENIASGANVTFVMRSSL